MPTVLTAMPHLSKLTGRRIWQLSLENLTGPSKIKSEESKWVLLCSGSDLLSWRNWNGFKSQSKFEIQSPWDVWWRVNFCGTICSFWKSTDRTSKWLFRAQSAEVQGEGMFAQILPALFQNPSFQEAVLTALLEAGLSLPAACWVCTHSGRVSKPDGHCGLC